MTSDTAEVNVPELVAAIHARRTASVDIQFERAGMGRDGDAVSRIHKAFGILQTPQEQIELLVALIRLWGQRDDKKRQEEAKKIFGALVEKAQSASRMTCTLTAGGRQFRVWYGLPGSFRPDHVDSCGENLLFGVYGAPDDVKPYCQAITEAYRLREVKLPNGCAIYLYWDYR